MQGFYGMSVPLSAQFTTTGITPTTQLIRSIHNTRKQETMVALVQNSKLEAAQDQLSDIHNILRRCVLEKYHINVFIPGKKLTLTGRQVDSIFSCNSSSYASTLLTNFNPQDGDDAPTSVVNKRFRTVNITYAKAAKSSSTPHTSQNSLSILTDLDKLYESMSARFGNQFGSKVSITDLEKQVEKTTEEIKSIRNSVDEQLTSLQNLVEQLTTKVNTQYSEINTTVQSLVETIAKQNYIIAGIQQEFKISMETLSKNLVPHLATSHLPSTTSAIRRSSVGE
jgi:archaellum component FlaC